MSAPQAVTAPSILLTVPPLGNASRERGRLDLIDESGACLASMMLDGTASNLTLDLRAIFWMMAESGASSALLTHVHPSGDPTPSRNDIDVTRRLWRGARLLGVRLQDHVILGDGAAFSFRNAGLL